MVTHSSILAWRIPWTEESGRLQSMGSQRAGHGFTFTFVINLCMLNRLSRVRLFVTSWTVACQAPLSLGFPGQEYWSGQPFLSPGDLPGPGFEPTFLMCPALVVDSLPLSHWEGHDLFIVMPIQSRPPGVVGKDQVLLFSFYIDVSWG